MSRTILVAGGSGFLGRALSKHFSMQGWNVFVLSRKLVEKNPYSKSIGWSPKEILTGENIKTSPILKILSEAKILINLSGENIASGRLTPAHVKKLSESRIESTQALGKLWRLARRPKLVWMQTSAVGFYGNRGEHILDETTSVGSSPLSNICNENEKAFHPFSRELEKNGGRALILRPGMVWSKNAMAWSKMILPIQWGLGGAMGNGKQWWSWIHMDDFTRAISFLAENKTCRGVFNLVSPESSRQMDIVKTLAKFLNRPAFFKMPKWVLRLLFGKLADEIFLASCRVFPFRLLKAGYKFKSTTLIAVVRLLLGKKIH